MLKYVGGHTLDPLVEEKLADLADFYWGKYSENVSSANILSKGEHSPLLIEECNGLAHLSVIWRTNHQAITKQKRLDNIVSAQNHLRRAWLDSHKILWRALLEDFKFAITDRFRANCFRKKHPEIIQDFNNCIDASVKARNFEHNNVGIDVEESIRNYSELWITLRSILFDMNNGNIISSELSRIKSKIIVFLGSVFGTFIAGEILYKITEIIGQK